MPISMEPLDGEMVTTVVLEVFTQKNFVADFIRLKSLFEPPFGGLSGKVHTLPIACWIARGRLRIRHD